LFIVAACGDKGITFLKGEAQVNVRKNEPSVATGSSSQADTFKVKVGNNSYVVHFDKDGNATVNGHPYEVEVAEGANAEEPESSGKEGGAMTEIKAPMPGVVVKVHYQPGEKVAAGEAIMTLEAMKMEMPVTAAVAGKVDSIAVKNGDSVSSGQLLATIQS